MQTKAILRYYFSHSRLAKIPDFGMVYNEAAPRKHVFSYISIRSFNWYNLYRGQLPIITRIQMAITFDPKIHF